MTTIKTRELIEIDFKLGVLDKIIQEARANGDERWQEAARQAAILNQQRGALLKAEYEKQGIDKPPTRITATVGVMGAKGER